MIVFFNNNSIPLHNNNDINMIFISVNNNILFINIVMVKIIVKIYINNMYIYIKKRQFLIKKIIYICVHDFINELYQKYIFKKIILIWNNFEIF